MSGRRTQSGPARAGRLPAAAALLLGLALACGAALAQQPPATVSEPEAERRVQHLFTELRCLVCQNQTLADSNAELAVDLRNQVREQVAAGRSDAEIAAYLVARYGDFVLYRPPLKASTLLLWVGPFVLLAATLWMLLRLLRRRRADPQAPPDPQEQARAAALLGTAERGPRDA